jgi:two-component system CheB/CheR fusion protein
LATSTVSRRRKKPDALIEASGGTPSVPGLCIVGIGASAGGYEAITNFFHAMPADSGVAFVIVQHLDPTHASLAAEMFGRCTAMRVSEATDGVRLEADHVYTAPSDSEISVLDGCLRLTPRASRKTLHLPIDHFFSSLGAECGARAIGIVLSGTGSDGTLGLKVIATNGGIVLVQQPETAQFDGMPRSAISAGIANFVLPVEQMPALIAGYARHPYAVRPAEPESDAESGGDEKEQKTLLALFKIIQTRHGYDFSGYKRGTLLRRIHRRMGLHSILKATDYLSLLKGHREEVDALFRDLLIGVTEFFRDPEAWKALDSGVMAPLVAGKREDETIRIWIPGCSTGEEAYTMAMLVLERQRQARKHGAVQIFATDTNSEALDVARLGRYPAGIAASVPAALLKRYFVTGPDHDQFAVTDELRASVVFGLQNLSSDPPFGRVDLISCRNVLIYLEPELQKRVLHIFHFALRPDAFLFLGSAESNSGRDDLFKPVSRTWRIYRREASARADSLALPLRMGDSRPGLATAQTLSGPAVSQVAGIAQKLILDRFAPASVLVNGRHEALYFCGPTDEFLLRPRGVPTQDLLTMVREGLRSRTRAALSEAAQSHLPVHVTGARMKCPKGFVPVRITVTPSSGENLGPLYLVVFQHDIEPLLAPPGSAEGALVSHLEEELKVTRDDLQIALERFESSNDSLRISNEEVVTTNEELRSLNEELESSKEELQTLNEELTTANQQLEGKVRELEVSNSDLHNLLNSNDIATLCLDQDFRIKWFTPATQTQFKFKAADVGRPIGDFSMAWSGGGLLEAARAVLATRAVDLLEFQASDGRRFVRRVLPYKNDAGEIHGVILTYTDITELRLATEAARTAHLDLSQSRDQERRLRDLSTALAMAEERERRALAQDLHDDLGQLLAVVALKATAIKKHRMPAPLKAAVDDCANAVTNANRKLRTLAFQLNPPMLEQLGFQRALEWMGDEMNRLFKLDVHIVDDGVPKPMDPAVSATLFRAVRELLVNVAKHAGVNTAMVTTAKGERDTLVLTVSDAGAGFEPDARPPEDGLGGFGLLSVRERLGLLGGEVSVRSNPGDGTSVLLRVPLLTQPLPAALPSTGRRP